MPVSLSILVVNLKKRRKNLRFMPLSGSIIVVNLKKGRKKM